MSDASDADRLEQELAVVDADADEEPAVPLEAEVPVEDAVEQHRPVGPDDDEYDHG